MSRQHLAGLAWIGFLGVSLACIGNTAASQSATNPAGGSEAVSAGASTPEVADIFPKTPNPVTVKATLDTAHAVSNKMLAQPGIAYMGQVSGQSSDGTGFMLQFPGGLLSTDAGGNQVPAYGSVVTVTPISAIEGIPFSKGYLAAVHIAPEGTLLIGSASLGMTIPIGVQGLVDVAGRHLLHRAHAELDAVGGAGREVQQSAVLLGPVDEARGAAQRLHRRVVGVRGEPHACLFGHGQHLAEEVPRPVPQLLLADAGQVARRRLRVEDHVPDHPVGDRPIGDDRGGVEAHRRRLAAAERPLGPAPPPAMLKLYPMIGIPALPTFLTVCLTISICCARIGPSRRMSCQCAGSKFSMASQRRPWLSMVLRIATSSSTVQRRSRLSVTPHPRSSSPRLKLGLLPRK